MLLDELLEDAVLDLHQLVERAPLHHLRRSVVVVVVVITILSFIVSIDYLLSPDNLL